MKYCKHCGIKLHDAAVICPECKKYQYNPQDILNKIRRHDDIAANSWENRPGLSPEMREYLKRKNK